MTIRDFSTFFRNREHPLYKAGIYGNGVLREELARFGLEPKEKTEHSHKGRPERENPVDTFNIEMVKDILIERNLGEMRPVSRFVNEVVWGNQPGAIRLWISPGYGVFMDRMGLDLLGQPKWCTKRYYQINRHGYGGFEETVTQELYDHLENIYHARPDSPKPEYPDLRKLAVNLANRINQYCRPIFLFDQIRQIHENRYLVCFNLRGQGVQAMDQKRVEKNVTEVLFYPKEGSIRIFNTNYESPLKERKWELVPLHSDFCFFPTQPQEEMIDPVVTIMRYY